MTTTRFPFHAPLLATAAAALMLVACAPDESQTAGQQVDQAVAQVEKRAEEAKADASAATDRMADKVEDAAGKAASKVEDAAITASVNAELAKDPALSALQINVDTSAGRVVLRGKAPDAAARERATRLASAVDGVVSVDNQLEIRS